jgi:hypothetical protein
MNKELHLIHLINQSKNKSNTQQQKIMIRRQLTRSIILPLSRQSSFTLRNYSSNRQSPNQFTYNKHPKEELLSMYQYGDRETREEEKCGRMKLLPLLLVLAICTTVGYNTASFVVKTFGKPESD